MFTKACILHSSWSRFSLDPHLNEFWTFNCSRNVWLHLPWFLWVKLANLRNIILKGENQLAGEKKPNLSDLIIGVCPLLFFRATELITLHLYRQYASCLAALPSLSLLCDTCKSLSPIVIKRCRTFFSRNRMLPVFEITGIFFPIVCVCVCARASTCVITQKLAKGDDLFCSTLRLTHPLVLHQEAEV